MIGVDAGQVARRQRKASSGDMKPAWRCSGRLAVGGARRDVRAGI